MLKIENLIVNYGGIEAVKGISLEVPDGSIITLVGANGAGKSTTLRSIVGLVKARSGSITLDGEELLGQACHHRYRVQGHHAGAGGPPCVPGYDRA